MTLVSYKSNNIEFIIDNKTGEAFATIRGYARMVNKAVSTINERFEGVRFGELKTAEVLTAGGLQGVRLIPADLVFDMALEDCIELARAMGKAGATTFMHQLVDFKVPVTYVPKTYKEALIALIAAEEAKEELLLEQARLQAITDELNTYSSIIRVAKLNGVSEKLFSWRPLKKASEQLEVDVLKSICPRYGTKNLYHHQAWTMVYPETKLPTTKETK